MIIPFPVSSYSFNFDNFAALGVHHHALKIIDDKFLSFSKIIKMYQKLLNEKGIHHHYLSMMINSKYSKIIKIEKRTETEKGYYIYMYIVFI